MLSTETEILMLSSRLTHTEYSKTRIKELVATDVDWDVFFEQAVFHRMVPIVLKTFKKINILKKIHSHIISAMRYKYMGVITRNEIFNREIEMLNRAFIQENIKAVIMKGAILSCQIYKDIGLREFGDVDYIVKKKDLSKVESILKKLGYVQGIYDCGEKKIIPASKKEILFKKMYTHEDFPYCKLNKNGFCPAIYVDINFEMMWKGHNINNNHYLINIEKVLENTMLIEFGSSKIFSLDLEYQLLHLCLHLFSEAVYFIYEIYWAQKIGDLKLFRFCDIYELIQQGNVKWEKFKFLIRDHGLEEPVYYTLSLLNKLYQGAVSQEFLADLGVDEKTIDKFYDYDGKDIYWDLRFFDRMFIPSKKPAELKRRGIL